jgi:hypothetical protein
MEKEYIPLIVNVAPQNPGYFLETLMMVTLIQLCYETLDSHWLMKPSDWMSLSSGITADHLSNCQGWVHCLNQLILE